MLKITKKEIETLKKIIKKIEEDQKNESLRIKVRRKMQKQGKSLKKGSVGPQKKPVRTHRKVTKKRSSIR